MSSSNRYLGWIVAALLGVVAVLLASSDILQRGEAAQPAPRQVSARGALYPQEQATIDLFETARPSVVHITTQARVVDMWTRNAFEVPRGSGSGFIWDDRGHIVTNNHVVAGASAANVRLADGRDVSASLVGVSPAHDLAVIRIEVENLPSALPVGASSDLRVGQSTFAIGNPFGLDWTLTTGIISALDRSLPAEDGRALIEHLIQTDAAINPGNSGGPLLDSAGRLIGVNTLIYSPSGASAGVGFAVPVDTVNRVVPQLIATGRYVRPALGIQVDEGVNRVFSQRLGIAGVFVLRVYEGSNAAAAGLRGVTRDRAGRLLPGDVIVAIDGTQIDNVPRLLARLDDYRVGDTVRLTLLRDDRRVEVQVRLQEGDQ
jgi:S1-C subfamily serine protease